MWSIFFPCLVCISIYMSVDKTDSVLICNKNLCKHIMRKLITFTHSLKFYKQFLEKSSRMYAHICIEMNDLLFGHKMLKQ